MQNSLNSIMLYNFESFTHTISYNFIITPIFYPYVAPSLSLVIASLSSVSMSLFLFCLIHQFNFQIPHIHDIIGYLCFCLAYFTQYDNLQGSIHFAANGITSCLFMAKQYSIGYIQHIFFYPFICWTLRLLPCFGYCK